MKIKQLYTSFGIFLDIFKSAWFWSTSSFHHYSRAVVVGNFNLQPSLSFCKVSSIVRWYMTKIISYSSSFKYFWSKGAGLSQHNEVVIVVCCGAGAIIITGIIQYVVPFSRLVSTSWKLEPIVWEATYIRAIITKVKFRKKSHLIRINDNWEWITYCGSYNSNTKRVVVTMEPIWEFRKNDPMSDVLLLLEKIIAHGEY